MGKTELDPGSTPKSFIDRLQASHVIDDDWERLFVLYGRFLQAYAEERWQLSTDDANSFVHDVLIRVREKIGTFRKTGDRGGFRAWLKTILNNAVRDCIRTDERHRNALGSEDFRQFMELKMAPPPDGDTDAILNFVAGMVGPRRRKSAETFVEHIIKGRSPVDVADEFNVKPNTVMKNSARVLDSLRAELPSQEELLDLMSSSDDSDGGEESSGV